VRDRAAGAHYVAADGSHRVVIAETDDVVGAYRNIQNYTQWVEYDTDTRSPQPHAYDPPGWRP
jgi:hypothetical protein